MISKAKLKILCCFRPALILQLHYGEQIQLLSLGPLSRLLEH